MAVYTEHKMTDNLKKVPDFDDLLFETRNREYGAYQLRKRYNSVVIAGIIIGSLLVSLAVIIPFVLIPQNDHILTGGTRFVQVQMDNLEPPDEEIIIPPAPPPPEAARIQEIVKYVPPVVVDSLLTTEKPMATTDDILAQPSEEQFEITGNGNGENLLCRRRRRGDR